MHAIHYMWNSPPGTAKAMGDHYGRKSSHASALNWARAVGGIAVV
ncbi:MAG: hypothetical protein RXS42_08800 [Nitrososphaeria archaeon]